MVYVSYGDELLSYDIYLLSLAIPILLGGIYFWDGDVLFDSGSIAMHEDCCCDMCTWCVPPSGTPDEIQVVISGVTNDGCADCGDFNDTFICSRAAFQCYWTSDEFTVCNWAHTIRVVINDVGITVTDNHVGPLAYVAFRKSDESVDCANLSSESIPFLSDYDCDASSASCAITAL